MTTPKPKRTPAMHTADQLAPSSRKRSTDAAPIATVPEVGATPSTESEQTVLGALMTFPEAGALVDAVGLRESDFFHHEHRLIFGEIQRHRAAGAALVDLIVVFDGLAAKGKADSAGGRRYLVGLTGPVLNAGQAGVHAAIVKQAAQRRNIAALSQSLAGNAAALPEHELRSRVRALVAEIDRTGTGAANDAGPALPVEWASDLPAELQAPRQIVEGVLTAGGMSMVFGESNSGKSYLVIHLAICLSLGLPWLGRRTERGAVLYVAAEGAWSIRLRLAAFTKHFDRQVGAFGLIPAALSLVDPSADVEALIEMIQQHQAKSDETISLIVVDTVARVMGGGDENTAQDMGRLVMAGDRIRELTGAHVLYIHHAGKDASRGARGHSSLRAALDTEIEVTADEATKTHTAKITKQRDLPSKGDSISGRFVSVELGEDQWGNAITACAVVEADANTAGVKAGRLTSTQRAVLAYLSGQSGGVRRPVIVEALESQGTGRASVYRAVNDLLIAALITDTLGLLYVPKP